MFKKQQLIITRYTNSPVTEAFRTLRTNIQNYQSDGPLKLIMFTSVGPKEGKSTLLANLAVAFAWSGKRVLVIDCDLRRPVQSRIFEKANLGITEYLLMNYDWKTLIQNTKTTNLDILGSGFITSTNPAELLVAPRMGKLLAQLKDEYDYLFVDTPPVSLVADASVLAAWMDGIYLVIATDTVSPEMANQARELLENANGRICGVVLNRTDYSKKYSYYYGNKEKRADQKRRLTDCD